MKKIDIRFKASEIALLKGLCGSTLHSVYHDPFTFANTSLQIVKLQLEESNYFLYSFAEPKDYFGSEEDVAVWSFGNTEYPAVSKKAFIEMPINEKIQKVFIIQENQKLFEAGSQTYDVWLTRGLVFDFGDHQISFEKSVWFSEDIIIRKGYDLVNEFSPTENFTDSKHWAPGITASCTREVISI